MPLVALTGIRFAHGTHVILDGATFAVEPGERIGLVGRNGQGKSTLLRIIAGELEPDAGSVQVERGVRIGYLSQHPDLDHEQTVRGAAESAFAELASIERDLERVYDEMAGADDAAIERLLRRQAELEARREAAGGFVTEHRVEAALHGVGFTDSQFEQRIGTLSGGQRGRLALARLLLESPDLLLLDEPTNHLDIAGRRWLESFLADEFRGAVVLVSHDRWLLDRVVHRIEEVEQGLLHDYPGNYAQYRALRAERQLAQARAHQKQLDHIRREEAFIRRYKAGQRAKQARGRETRLDRFRSDTLIERPSELDVFEVRLPPAPRVGDHVLVATGLSKAFGERRLFRDLDLAVAPRERLGIVGPNGAGKTTLVRCLLGEEPLDSGDLRVTPRLRAAWFRQTQDHLDPALSVWEYLQTVIVGEDGAARASEQQARDLAGAFLFSGADQEKRLGSLSGGERSRAVIAGLIAGARNLIVLDEPTNHLDIPSTERLESALATAPEDGGFDGAIILISHDRALLSNVCDRLLVIDGTCGAEASGGRVGASGWRLISSDVAQWLAGSDDRRTIASESSEPRAETMGRASAGVPTNRPDQGKSSLHASRTPSGGSSRAAPIDRESRRLARLEQSELEARIETLEAKLRAIDTRLAEPATWKDPQKSRLLTDERSSLAAQLAPLEAEWLRRTEAPGK